MQMYNIFSAHTIKKCNILPKVMFFSVDKKNVRPRNVI